MNHTVTTAKLPACSLMHITVSLCWPAYEIPLGLHTLLHFSPLSLLTYSSVLVILSFLHWGKRRFVTHYLSLLNDGQVNTEDYPLTETKKTTLCWPRAFASVFWCLWRTRIKDGKAQRVLPQTWSWRRANDAAWGCFGGVEGFKP